MKGVSVSDGGTANLPKHILVTLVNTSKKIWYAVELAGCICREGEDEEGGGRGRERIIIPCSLCRSVTERERETS
jgi:hypothetical protein